MNLIELPPENKQTKIDYKFKEKGDYFLDGKKYRCFNEVGLPSKIFKLNGINMKNGKLQLCFKCHHNGKEMYRTKVYDYTTYTKNSPNNYIPKLINLF